MELSVVIPVCNEHGTIRELYRRLRAAIAPDSEIIFVDDGSSDGSAAIMSEIAAADPAVRLVRFRRNFGKTAALDAGFSIATGTWVAVLDADLQNEPEDVPRLLAHARTGYDVVSGWRRRRQDPFLTKTFPSRLANRLVSRATGLELHDHGCALKVYRRELLAGFPLTGDMHRMLAVHLFWRGARVAELEVAHHPRRSGASHFGLERVHQVLLDLLAAVFLNSSSARPIRFFGGLGLFGLLLAGLSAGLGFWLHRAGRTSASGFVFFAAVLLVGVSVISALLGLLAELVVRSAQVRKGEKDHRIEQTINR